MDVATLKLAKKYTNTKLAEMSDDKVVIYDSFNRADGAIGNSDTGETWGYVGSTGTAFAVANNLATTGDVATGAMLLTFQKDGSISAKMPSIQTSNGITIRFTDMNNFIAMYPGSTGAWKLAKRVGGTYTDIASFGTAVANDTVKISFNGSILRVYINGVFQAKAIVADFKTATKHGLFNLAGATSSAKWDDFKLGVL